MKKIVAITVFLSFAASWGFSQVEEPIRFGLQLSPTFNWLSSPSSRVQTSGTNIGIKLGMMSEYYFAENYAFMSGIAISFNSGGTLLYEYGGTYWPESDLADVEVPPGSKFKYNLQYLEIPLGLKLKTNEFGYIRYFFEPAFTLAFATQSRGQITATGTNIDPNEKFDIRKEVNVFNASWGLGLGLEYSMSSSTLLVGGITFSSGLVDVIKDNGTVNDPDRGEISENYKETLNSITIKVGVMF